jgi:hypothetical protein
MRWEAIVAKSHPDDPGDTWWNVQVRYPDGGFQLLWCRNEVEACALTRQINGGTAGLVSAPECDPVGAVEIAARLGVARQTVDMWRQRDIDFPEPTWTVGGRPAWNWPIVAAWATETGRVPGS